MSKIEKEIGILNGYERKIKTWAIPIPQNSSDFKIFCSAMKEEELKIKTLIVNNDKALRL